MGEVELKESIMQPLTAKQRQTLEFIEARLDQNAPPSQREIADHFGLAQNAAYQLVSYLRKKGYLVDSVGHRGIRLSEEYARKRSQTEGIPILGRVAAGTPILAQQNIQGYMTVEKLFGRDNGMFLLKVAGDSMVDEGILDGDYVVVRGDSTLDDGQIGIVLLDDEATVKRVFIQKDRIALKPANRRAGYKTRYIKQFDKNVRILGRVVGCIRTGIQ
jgi:repressor LexA